MRTAAVLLPALLAATGITMTVTSNEESIYVARVVDGDTAELSDGSRVRFIGIDAPEADEPCGERATRLMRRLVEGRDVIVRNPSAVEDQDRYGRLLRYVDTATDTADPAASLLRQGLALARYDSTDGYDRHPRQNWYHALEASALPACPTLDRESRWFGKPERFEKHVEARRLARLERVREARSERRAERQRRAREARAQRREAERLRIEQELQQAAEQYDDPAPISPDNSYTGQRCYAPGGQTWRPC